MDIIIESCVIFVWYTDIMRSKHVIEGVKITSQQRYLTEFFFIGLQGICIKKGNIPF
jgi:hypothetical protein